MPPNEEYLGVDVGAARVGVARGSIAARIAEPLMTLPAPKAIEELAKLAKDHQSAGIVVGLPRSLAGKETEQTGLVRDWVAKARQVIALPFYWQDEALTSRLSEGSKHDIDSAAAAIILQDFLDIDHDDRVKA